MMMRSFLRTLAVAMALAFTGISTALAADLLVSVADGQVRGSRAEGVDAFKGIPFAAPATGDRRWAPPQPVQPWQGVRDATRFGPDCMQTPFPGDEAPLRTQPGEDCLSVNVWRPADLAEGAKRPVLVWIYGGAFMTGGTSPAIYDGAAMARQGVVFVSLNYRLGRFGFFAHPALTAADQRPLGNYAMMDQIAALTWVKQNIARFGGDPGQVTIMGESAGGTSVINLMTMPAAKGLFHRAVIMSGGGRSLLPTTPLKDAEQVGVNFARSLGIQDDGAAGLAALRQTPAEAVRGDKPLFQAMVGPGPKTYVGGFVAEGELMTGLSDDLMKQGRVEKVPVMIGMTSADAGINMARDKDSLFGAFGPAADRVRSAYDPDGKADFKAVADAVARDRFMAEPARFVARAVVDKGAKAFVYRYGYVAQSMRATWASGTPHAAEIPYFLDTVTARYGDKATAQDQEAARLVSRYLVNFVRTGDPNGKGLPAWPAYQRGSEQLLTFNQQATAVAGTDPLTSRLDALATAADGAP